MTLQTTTNYTPAQWVLIHTANAYGLDKQPYDERLKFGRAVLEHVRANDESELNLLANNAESGVMFKARVTQINDILNGVPSGMLLGQDASSSGIQLMSVLGRDVKGMSLTGVLGTDVPSAYGSLLKEISTHLPNIVSKQVKLAAIPYMYGSNAAPERVFGDNVKVFEEAYFNLFKAAFEIRSALLDAWDSDYHTRLWDMPDGQTAYDISIQKYSLDYEFAGLPVEYQFNKVEAKDEGRSLPANVIHSFDAYVMREVTTRAGISHEMLTNALLMIVQGYGEYSENLDHIVECGEASNMVSIAVVPYLAKGYYSTMSSEYEDKLTKLIEHLLKLPRFVVRGIHDEFQCLANYQNIMKQLYNDILVEAYRGEWLSTTLASLGAHVDIPEVDEEVANNIAKALYAIH